MSKFKCSALQSCDAKFLAKHVERHVETSMSKKKFRHGLGGAVNAADAADAVNAALCTSTVENLLSTVMSNMSKVALELLSKVIFRQYILVERKMQG